MKELIHATSRKNAHIIAHNLRSSMAKGIPQHLSYCQEELNINNLPLISRVLGVKYFGPGGAPGSIEYLGRLSRWAVEVEIVN